jgi:hypothetical protein
MDTGELNGVRGDTSRIESYLYKLNRQLEYMFNNLAPEDNYSEQARLTYVSDGERQASIETALDGIKLTYVSKDNIISSINLSEETAAIEAPKIKLEGLVTVNGYFKIGLDGSIEATNGAFSGDITASTITGSTFQLNRGANVGFIADGETFRLGDFVVNDWWGRQVLESTDETTGMSGEPDEEGGLYLWAGYYDEDDYSFVVNRAGAYVMYGGEAYNIGETLSRLSNMAYFDGEDPDEDPDPDEEEDDWDGTSPDGKPDPGYVDSGPGVGL